jgi:hypothetical protein
MSHDDLTYYLQRAAIEREMAQTAANPKIAAIHEELARGYDALAKQPPAELLRAVG